MKLRITCTNPFGPKFTCIDDNEYDGAPDAGPQLIGLGETQEEARADFMDQWVTRESERDLKNAVEAGKVWDDMMRKLVFGGPRS